MSEVARVCDLRFHAHGKAFICCILINRVISPALVAPHLAGLMESQPSAPLSQHLVLIAKILQLVAFRLSPEKVEFERSPILDFAQATLSEVPRFVSEATKKMERAVAAMIV